MELRRTITGIVNFYVDGFRHITWGRTLWIVILVKLVIIFVLLRIFFFPNYIATHRGTMRKSDFVRKQVLKEAPPPQRTPGLGQ